jgi:hypothetical protein
MSRKHESDPTSYDAPPPTAGPTANAAAAMDELSQSVQAVIDGLRLLHAEGHECIEHAQQHLDAAKTAMAAEETPP